MKGYAAFKPYQKNDGFWHWFDEIQAESLPYQTKEAAEDAIERYRNCYLRPWRPRLGSTAIKISAKLEPHP